MYILHLGLWPKHDNVQDATLKHALQINGLSLSSAPDLASGLASRTKPDILLLGANDKSQFFLAQIQKVQTERQTTLAKHLPLIVLSTQPSSQQIAQALNAGADDVISITQSPAEIIARLHAIKRRTDMMPHTNIIRTGKLSINFTQLSASINQTSLPLTQYEFSLLATMAQQLDHVVPNHTLRSIFTPAISDNSLKVHLKNLKAKLSAADPNTQYVQTHQSLGRRLRSLPVPKGQ